MKSIQNKTRLKKYKIVFDLTHESYNGCVHRDGQTTILVLAKNDKSAVSKALKEAKKDGGGYDYKLFSIIQYL